MKKTGIRYSATNIPKMKIFNIDYTCGNSMYDTNDINTLIGTYWYDPIDFLKNILHVYKNNNFKEID